MSPEFRGLKLFHEENTIHILFVIFSAVLPKMSFKPKKNKFGTNNDASWIEEDAVDDEEGKEDEDAEKEEEDEEEGG